ncbi:hypothetical protein IHE45_17G093100 [Dioscorea alata]|uniref:Uncharacterized protein n=1 Tax=Dioscorea alata TaxID=55571 RepID=A0ACB7UEA0_DIOAL|nr:hypothetical protein IHE45_17G093100 [Dioscorea alata]
MDEKGKGIKRSSSFQNEEDEEMEKFNELMLNMKAMKDLWKSSYSSSKKAMKKEIQTWTPSFNLEDFKEDGNNNNKNNNIINGDILSLEKVPHEEGEEEKENKRKEKMKMIMMMVMEDGGEEEKNGLDLSLSL